jgi:6,7-dimethyl-8-ribityllumazine synthase
MHTSFSDNEVLGRYTEPVTSGVSAMQFEAQMERRSRVDERSGSDGGRTA